MLQPEHPNTAVQSVTDDRTVERFQNYDKGNGKQLEDNGTQPGLFHHPWAADFSHNALHDGTNYEEVQAEAYGAGERVCHAGGLDGCKGKAHGQEHIVGKHYGTHEHHAHGAENNFLSFVLWHHHSF